jgi:hypothetical protein
MILLLLEGGLSVNVLGDFSQATPGVPSLITFHFIFYYYFYGISFTIIDVKGCIKS